MDADRICVVVRTYPDNILVSAESFDFSPKRENAQEIRSIFQKSDSFRIDFRDLTIAYAAVKNTILPSQLKADLEFVFGHEFGAVENQHLLFQNAISEPDLECAWSINPQMHNSLVELFPKANLISAYTAWIQQNVQRSSRKQNAAVDVWMFQDRFYVSISENGKHLFSNTFEAENTEDILYFVLFSMDQINIKPEDSELLLCSNEVVAVDYSLLKSYIPLANSGTIDGLHYDNLSGKSMEFQLLPLNLVICE